MRHYFKRFKSEDGQSAVLAAILLVVVLGFAALALDLGMVKIAESNMQNAADAAALAAVSDLPDANDAANTALVYAQLNGVNASGVTVNTTYNGETDQIEVICSQNVEFTFAKVLGFNSTIVSGRAVAKKGSGAVDDDAFGYAIFSGSQNDMLGLYGAKTYIEGDIHTNNDFMMTGAQSTIDGSIEAVYNLQMYGSKIDVSGMCQGANITTSGSNISIGSEVETSADVIDMPDYSDVIQAAAESAGQTYAGYTTFQGSNVNLDEPIYVQGDVNVSGSSFSGSGAMLATGNIQISGANINASGGSVCMYSENGNISISGSNTTITGLLYAPNGTVSIHGANTKIYGRIVAKKVIITGSNTQIITGSGDLDGLNFGGGGTSGLVE